MPFDSSHLDPSQRNPLYQGLPAMPISKEQTNVGLVLAPPLSSAQTRRPAPIASTPSVSLSLPAVSLHSIMAPSSPPPLLDRTGSHAAAGHKRNVTGGCHENPHLWGTSTGTKAIDAREVNQGKRTLFSHPSSLFPPTILQSFFREQSLRQSNHASQHPNVA